MSLPHRAERPSDYRRTVLINGNAFFVSVHTDEKGDMIVSDATAVDGYSVATTEEIQAAVKAMLLREMSPLRAFAAATPAFNESGSKYLRDVPCVVDGKVDVYAVIDAFGVTCPARQHALKKLLCAGLRSKGSVEQDLVEARDAVDRAIQMHQAKQGSAA